MKYIQYKNEEKLVRVSNVNYFGQLFIQALKVYFDSYVFVFIIKLK